MRSKLSLFSLAVSVFAVAVLAATPAAADPVRYEFDSGFVTLTASVGGVDISSPVTADLIGSQVTIDEDTPELISIELDATGPIEISFAAPYAGYDEVVLESLSLSGGSGMLVALDAGPTTTEYFFLVNPLAIDVVLSADGPTPIDSAAIGTEAPASGSLFVAADLDQLSLSGITLGAFDLGLGLGDGYGYVDGTQPIVLKADFVFSGSPIPEPSAALLFLVGSLTLVGGRRALKT